MLTGRHWVWAGLRRGETRQSIQEHGMFNDEQNSLNCWYNVYSGNVKKSGASANSERIGPQLWEARLEVICVHGGECVRWCYDWWSAGKKRLGEHGTERP